jgi:signal transduction histidine kinase
MATTAAAAHVQRIPRDPVLLLPLVVAAGVAVGALGLDAHVQGGRIVSDLALAWTLMAAALITLDRPGWQRASWVCVAAALAVLAGDLQWSASRWLWTAGLLLEQLWVALLVALVLAFAVRRAGRRLAGAALAAAFGVALGGQALGAIVTVDPRDVLAVAPDAGVALAIDRAQELAAVAVGLVLLYLVLRRMNAVGSAGLRLPAPIFAAATSIMAGLVWLAAVIASDASQPTLETVGRAVCVSLPIALVAAVLGSRLRQAEVSDLVVELRAPAATTLRERLSEALGDPTLEVVYRLGPNAYVDAEGRATPPPRSGERAVTAVTVAGEEVASLVHDPALLDEPELVDSVRAVAALVLENERLAAEVRSQLGEVRASRGRIVAAADDERRRIERDLHDGAQQRLVALSVGLGLEAARSEPAAADILARAQDEVDAAIAELRELARGIHPTLLRDEGLQAGVEALARRAPLPVAVQGVVRERLPETVELAAYYVVSEALTNVAKHAAATEATVRLDRADGVLCVSVSDDGPGGAHVEGDGGLAGLRDRLAALDATLSVESEPDRGTTIRAELPCG